jgi:exosortase B
MTEAVSKRTWQGSFGLGESWPLVLGFALLAIPTIVNLANQTWSHEAGAHGPIILAAGGWLIWRITPELKQQAKPGAVWITALLMVGGLLSYAYGRALDFITLEAAGVYAVGLAIANDKLGPRAIINHWFPFFYLAFAIPPPSYIIDRLTSPLKHFVSFVATDGLHALGYPIEREGVTLIIAQYQLLVEDACSGMNSLIGLTAITLMYIYLMHGSSWRYSALLVAFVIPIAIIANIVRISILVLITYYFGDQAGQGFLHMFAGIVLFATALLLVFGVDKLLSSVRHRLVGAPA